MALDPRIAGTGKKYFTLTYGCQMNVRDSEIISGLVEGMGYVEANSLEEADLILFNTCSVRHSAENKVFGKLGEVASLKRKNPDLLIAFGGCMAQLPEVREKLKRARVDVVFGTHNLHELPNLIEQSLQDKVPVHQVWDKATGIYEPFPSRRRPGISAFVNIMYGCDNFCSYCIVPYTRGRERSRHPKDVLHEVKEIAGQGYKEITLLGQNVNSYGKGLEEKVDFADLLLMFSRVEGIERIRFTTSHPKDVSDRLIDVLASGGKICEHIHMPLQAGSNQILKKMNRGYTREQYLQLVEKVRSRVPDIAISSDLIVGFPGETEADFMDTLDMVHKVHFDAAFTFMYSVRSGTKAAGFEEQVSLEEKKERLERLNQQQYAIADQKNRQLENTVQEILVEGVSKTNREKLTGRTRRNHIVIFSGPDDLIGQRVHVTITEARTFSLFGELQPDGKE